MVRLENKRPRLYNRQALKHVRRWLRNSPTAAEHLLWAGLSRSQLEGRKFRRQHSVGPYILDFYCPECRLAVELDGQGHFNSVASQRDYRRDQFLAGLGIRVLRFENRAVFENPEGVIEQIRRQLSTR